MDIPNPGLSKKVDESWKDQVEKERRLPSPPPAAAPSTTQAPAAKQAQKPASARAQAPGQAQNPETEFGYFLSSLTMQAMVALGEIPHPATNLPQENLDQARYFIDLLGMLDEKTRGNLTPEEASLLEGALYELRMKYVARTGGVAP